MRPSWTPLSLLPHEASLSSADPNDVAVLIPWQSGCPHRIAALQWTIHQYRTYHPNWQIVLGILDEGTPWCKAEAVANALKGTDRSVIVVADADSWAPGVGEAVAKIQQNEHVKWAMAHSLVMRLSEDATAEVYGGESYETMLLNPEMLAQSPYVGYEGGGVVALKRETYLRAPLDPRFKGFGQEDESWALALRVLAGDPSREPSPLWHMWHPPQDRDDRHWGSEDSKKMYERYLDAYLNGSMADLVAEIYITP